jgi:hypothetical protein
MRKAVVDYAEAAPQTPKKKIAAEPMRTPPEDCPGPTKGNDTGFMSPRLYQRAQETAEEDWWRPGWSHFRPVPVAPDGMCSMHALLAGMDLQQYECIPRNKSGYPLDADVLAAESKRARKLFEDLLRAASMRPWLLSVACECAERRTLDVTDYEWVSEVWQTQIRVTIDNTINTQDASAPPEHDDVIYVPSDPSSDSPVHVHRGSTDGRVVWPAIHV